MLPKTIVNTLSFVLAIICACYLAIATVCGWDSYIMHVAIAITLPLAKFKVPAYVAPKNTVNNGNVAFWHSRCIL